MRRPGAVRRAAGARARRARAGRRARVRARGGGGAGRRGRRRGAGRSARGGRTSGAAAPGGPARGGAVAVIAPAAWVVDDTGFPKDGAASPGVARQYCGSLGKVGNCQVGVSVHAVTDAASCPLSWRLFLPAGWDDAGAATPEAAAAIRERRARAAIPDTERHRPKWALALEMLDELAGWGLTAPVVVADAGYGNNADFRAGVTARGACYIVQV